MKRTLPTLQDPPRPHHGFRARMKHCRRPQGPVGAPRQGPRPPRRLTGAAAPNRPPTGGALPAARCRRLRSGVQTRTPASMAAFLQLIVAPAAQIARPRRFRHRPQGDATRRRSQPAAPACCARSPSRGDARRSSVRPRSLRVKRTAARRADFADGGRRSARAARAHRADAHEGAAARARCAPINTCCGRCSARTAASIRAAPTTRARRSSGTARSRGDVARRSPLSHAAIPCHPGGYDPVP